MGDEWVGVRASCLANCSLSVLGGGGPPSWPTMPIFTPHQDAALTAASNWLKATRGRASIFRLFGYAGTGKTTLAKHLAEGVDGKALFPPFPANPPSPILRNGFPRAATTPPLLSPP